MERRRRRRRKKKNLTFTHKYTSFFFYIIFMKIEQIKTFLACLKIRSFDFFSSFRTKQKGNFLLSLSFSVSCTYTGVSARSLIISIRKLLMEFQEKEKRKKKDCFFFRNE
jgi:hypothetical protein